MSKKINQKKRVQPPEYQTVTTCERLKYSAVIFTAFLLAFLVIGLSRADAGLTGNHESFFAFSYYIFGSDFVKRFIDLGATKAWFSVFAAVVALVLFALFSLVLECFIHSVPIHQKNPAILVSILFAVCPAGILLYTSDYLYGKEDVWVLLLTLCLVLCLKSKLAALLTPLLCFLCVAVSQLFIFTYLPLAAVAMLFYFNSSSLHKVIITLDALVIAVTFFATNSIGRAYNEYGTGRVIGGTAVGIALVLPVLLIAFGVWITTLRGKPHESELIYPIVCLACPVAAVPAFFIMSDQHGRWLTAVTVTQLLLLAFFSAKKVPSIIAALGRVLDLAQKHCITVMCAIAVYTSLLRIDAEMLGVYGNKLFQFFPF